MVERLVLLLAVAAAAAPGCRRQTPAPAPAAAVPPAPPASPTPPDSGAPLPADYDPTVLADKGGDPLQIYLNEPRSPTWAPVVEQVIGGQLRRDLKQMVPEARDLSMGCRTLSCLILVDVPKDKLEAASAVIGLVTLGPITADLGLSAGGKGQILVLTERRMADPADYTAWYRRTRRSTLDAIRAAKQPNPLPVSVDKLPAD
jgi:hypothetical protein